MNYAPHQILPWHSSAQIRSRRNLPFNYIGEVDTAAQNGTDVQALSNSADMVDSWHCDGTLNNMITASGTGHERFKLRSTGWTIAWQQRNAFKAAPNDDYAVSFAIGAYGAASSVNVFTYKDGIGNAGKMKVQMRDAVGSASGPTTASTAIGGNYAWQNFVLTYDRVAIRLHADGVEIGVLYKTWGDIYLADQPLQIGWSATPAGQMLGNFRRFAIFGRALDLVERYYLDEGADPLLCGPPPQFYLPMDVADVGGGLVDHSGEVNITNTSSVTGEEVPS